MLALTHLYISVPVSTICVYWMILPVGCLIEITVVVAPVNYNLQYNGLWSCYVLMSLPLRFKVYVVYYSRSALF